MKTQKIILSIIFLMVFVVSGMAETPTLSFFGKNGAIIEIPVKLEEASDSIPVEIVKVYEEEQKAERLSLVEKQFDIRKLSRPEKDTDDVEINTRKIFFDILMETASVKK